MEISSSEQSMLASWTRSLRASMSCLNTFPWVRRASNMVDMCVVRECVGEDFMKFGRVRKKNW